MMSRKLFHACVTLALSGLSAGFIGIAGRAQAAAQQDFGKIVSQKYDAAQMVTDTRLANGLTILSKEVHAAPVVYFSVWYKVGSRNEVNGQTGLSHILEHMMFKGTRDLPPGAIDQLFRVNGGQINANTGQDRTQYYELISADRLELAVRVEADRMINAAFDPTELSREMTVVRSELEGDSNDPGYQLYDFSFLPTAFVSSGYHWPTLGWKTDVEAVATRRNVIYQYYKDHYMPNNAVVVMVGDFDTKKAVNLCRKYFGVYPAGKLEKHHITPEIEQHGERRIALQRPGTTAQVLIGYHAPQTGIKDHYVLDVITQLLSGGRSARLYQALVETGIAQEAGADNEDTIDPYVFTLSASAASGTSPLKLEQGLEAEVAKLQDSQVSADELKRAFNQIDAAFTYQNDSVSEQANQLGTYEVISSFRYLDDYLKRIHQVTPAEIQTVAKKYLTAGNRTVATFDPQPLPPGGTGAPPAASDNFGASAPVTDPHQKALLTALEKKYNIVTSAASSKRPTPTRKVLANGMVVIVQENHSNHTVALAGLTRAGSAFDAEGKWGVSGLTASMLTRGTTSRTALQLALDLETVGAGVGIGADTESATFDGHCLTRDFGLTLNTLADELRNPSFPQDQFERLRSETLSALEQAREDAGGTDGPGALASIAFSQALYPKGHPYWSPKIEEQEAAIRAITTDDLRAFHDKYYRPDTSVLVIVGDVNTAQAVSAVEAAFGSWSKPATPIQPLIIPDIPLPAKSPAPQVIDIPDTMQTSVIWGYPGQLKRTDPDFYAGYVMSYILGGDTFGSRLGKEIRDQEGLAYTVYSSVDAAHGAGAFQAFVGANPQNAPRAASEIRRIIADMAKNGATDDEVRQAKLYLTGAYPLRLETNAGVAGQLLVAEDFHLGMDYIQKRASLYNRVTTAQVNAAAKKLLHPDRAVLIYSGAHPGSK
jgi:zinc protease